MVICYIGIGSNLGDRQQHIRQAVRKIRQVPDTKVMNVSPVMESEPCGGPPQGDYLNAVLELDTGLTPYVLLQSLQMIELELGRIRTIANGPRTIDLDILTYGEYILNEPALCIPHPRMLERDFVMKPLCAIAPHAVDMVRRLFRKSKAPADTGRAAQLKPKSRTGKTRRVRRVRPGKHSGRAKRQ
jgi:2-amino-4-hydroxy-6-hydroxymethyldihydropteridine diphosphokinase